MKKQITQDIKSIVLALIIVLGVGYVSASWTPAPPNPPSGNPDAPVNVGPDAQYKSGFFQINANDASGTSNAGWAFMVPGAPSYLHSLLVANNITTVSGKVGVGTASPTKKLDVIGDVGVNGKTTTTNLEVSADALVSGKVTSASVETSGIKMTTGASSGKVLTSDASGNATWSPRGSGSIFIIGDVNGSVTGLNCRYSNPITGSCSCPSGLTRYQVWDFEDQYSHYYIEQNYKVHMFQCW